MKTLGQIVIILLVSFAGELLNYCLPLPIPASIYGIVIPAFTDFLMIPEDPGNPCDRQQNRIFF